jgi:hypothetical protein
MENSTGMPECVADVASLAWAIGRFAGKVDSRTSPKTNQSKIIALISKFIKNRKEITNKLEEDVVRENIEP